MRSAIHRLPWPSNARHSASLMDVLVIVMVGVGAPPAFRADGL